MLDRFEPRFVTLGVLSLAAAGALVLWAGGLAAAPVAVLLLGLAAGAEVDLVSYLTSRAFGARAYSTIYGWLYSIFALGFGISPFLAGRVRDATGNYDYALLGGAGLVALAGILAVRLGRLRYARSVR